MSLRGENLKTARTFFCKIIRSMAFPRPTANSHSESIQVSYGIKAHFFHLLLFFCWLIKTTFSLPRKSSLSSSYSYREELAEFQIVMRRLSRSFRLFSFRFSQNFSVSFQHSSINVYLSFRGPPVSCFFKS